MVVKKADCVEADAEVVDVVVMALLVVADSSDSSSAFRLRVLGFFAGGDAGADADDADRDAFEASGYGEEAALGGQPEDVPGACVGRGVPVKQRRYGSCSRWRANGYLQKPITCQYCRFFDAFKGLLCREH